MSEENTEVQETKQYKMELSAELKNAVTNCRIDILRAYPFIAYLFMDCEVYQSEVIDTAAATPHPKNTILINEEFFMQKLNRKERNFVFIHELLHIYLEHIGRQVDNNYDGKVWNIATDFVINNYIVEMISSSANVLKKPDEILYDTAYANMTADQVYFKLLKDNKNNTEIVIQKYNGDGYAGEGKGQAPLDGVSDAAMSEAEKAGNKQAMAAGIREFQSGSNTMGSGTGSLIQAFKDLLEPQLPWSTLLQEFVTNSARSRYTYNRLSRKSVGQVCFPTMTGEHIKLVFGVDSSGSMSTKDIKESLTELQSICEGFDSWEVDYVTCDTDVHLIGQYNSADGDDFDSIDLNVHGGGGTEMSPMVVYANELEELPSVVVIVTDGYIPEEPLENAVEDIDVIVIVTSEGNKSLELENSKVIMMN